ncbi:MAG: hypothetical protein ACRDYV_01150 [Acidimicrobiia bacterium]
MALTDDTVVTGPSRHGTETPSTAETRRAAIARFTELLAEGYNRRPMFP